MLIISVYILVGFEKRAPDTVAELFANPPGWLPNQLKVYRQNPKRHFRPLCNTVAAVILEDPTRGEEVAEEVERELGEDTQSWGLAAIEYGCEVQ
jgi:hypothetical protein